MPNTASAKKRVRQNASRRALNRWRKDNYRLAVKDYNESILHGSVEDASTKLDKLYALLDLTAAKGAIHKNAASRYKGRLAARLNRKKSAAAPAAA